MTCVVLVAELQELPLRALGGGGRGLARGQPDAKTNCREKHCHERWMMMAVVVLLFGKHDEVWEGFLCRWN